jgi:hypothetical protein
MRIPFLPVLILLVSLCIGCDSSGVEVEDVNDPTIDLVVQGQPTTGGGVTFLFCFNVHVESFVTLTFRDEANKELRRIVNERRQSGHYACVLDVSEYADGTYRYRLEVAPTNGADVLVSTGTLLVHH